MATGSNATEAPKKARTPKYPYTVVPEEGHTFVDGKTVPFKGWRVTMNAPRGERKASVILYDEALTSDMLDAVVKSYQASTAKAS